MQSFSPLRVCLSAFSSRKETFLLALGIAALALPTQAQRPPARPPLQNPRVPVRPLQRPNTREPKRKTFTQRIERVATTSEPDPGLGIAMHTIERGLLRTGGRGASSGTLSEYDKAFDASLKRRRVSPAALALLQKAVGNYRSLPPKLRERIVPAQVFNLNLTQPITVSQTLSLFQKSGKANLNLNVNANNLGGIIPLDPNPSLQSNLTGIIPAKSQYQPGEKVQLDGSNFLKRDDVTVTVAVYEKRENFIEKYTVNYTFVERLKPLAGSNFKRLRIQLPNNLKPNQLYSLEVEQSFKGQKVVSPRIDFYGPAPAASPPPKPIILARPEITGFNPDGAFPGTSVVIEGNNFGRAKVIDGGTKTKAADYPVNIQIELTPPEELGLGPQFFPAQVMVPSIKGGLGQVRFTLPKDLIPGTYSVQLRANAPGIALDGANTQFEGGPLSLSKPFTVRAYRYQVNFVQMLCDDESDPEYWGGDELVTVWGINADGNGFSKISREYDEHGDSFDDGNDEYYDTNDRSVYSPTGGAADVRVVLSVSTTLLEWDDGDVKAAQEALGIISDIADAVAATATKIGGPAAAKVVVVASVVSVASKIISKLVAFFDNGPDTLGRQDLVWTAKELYALTDNPGKKSTGVLAFKNNDDTGSYRVTYEILRFQ